MKRCFFKLFVGFMVFWLSSCESTLKVTSTANGAKLSFDSRLGVVFQDTIKSISQNVDGDSMNEVVFETSEIQAELEKSGFKNPKVLANGISSLSVILDSEKTGSDPANKSGFVVYGDEKTTSGVKVQKVQFSKDNLMAIYNQLPAVFKSYLDLFGAPVFTGEDMTDQDYLEMIACVYGQPLADEVAASELKVCVNNGKTVSIPLVKVLNLRDEMKIN